MITKEQIRQAATKYVLENDISDAKYMQFAINDFSGGAEWAIEQMQEENEDLRRKINVLVQEIERVQDRRMQETANLRDAIKRMNYETG